MGIDWTTVIASAFTAAIVSGFTFITNRYLARVLDRIEREIAKSNKNGNGNGKDDTTTK